MKARGKSRGKQLVQHKIISDLLINLTLANNGLIIITLKY